MVLHSERFDYLALQSEWLKITGDSHVLNVTAAKHLDDPAQDFLEVFKYALKFSDLTPAQNLEAFQVIKSTNLLFSAGLFRGVVIPEGNLDEDLQDLPYVELFYQYLPSSGYNLSLHRDSEICKAGQFSNDAVKVKNSVNQNNSLDIRRFLNRSKKTRSQIVEAS
jgi:hypothetical protein